MKNTLADRLISWLDPVSGIRRAHARRVLAYYEAAKPDRLRKSRREPGSGNTAISRAGTGLRQQARHFEQNYDLALGVLNTLSANVIGPNGIGIEPQPRRADGSIDDALARQILDLWKDWQRRPEVTWQHDWPAMQRLLCRSWLRDGEVFAQVVSGIGPWLDHGTRVPLSLEMLEADYIPLDMQSSKPIIVQGIEINAWGRPIAYHVHKTDPLESGGLIGQTKRISADAMLHIANRHRIRQLRGVSVFASILQRFDDLKDYEESERIAAKIAASMAAFIRKGAPDQYEPETDGQPRSMQMRPGMIFDDLKQGEEIGTIDTNRPNPNLETYRSGQLKAIAAGAGPTYSSISRTYDGTYSAQRQELVEGWNTYATLSNEFIGRISRPVYEAFIAAAVASGQLRPSSAIVRDTLDDAVYLAPQMPWIDPKKEAEAFGMLEDRCYVSGAEIVRKRGGNPIDTIEQQSRWQREKAASGITSPETKVESKPDPKIEALDRRVTAMGEKISDKPVPAPVVNVAAPVINLGDTTITLPEQAAPVVNVAAPGITVHNALPEQPAPVVNIEVAAPDVTVHNALPEQPAPVVNITNEVQPAEVNVNLPARKTETTVVRDAKGNIATATQIETDL